MWQNGAKCVTMITVVRGTVVQYHAGCQVEPLLKSNVWIVRHPLSGEWWLSRGIPIQLPVISYQCYQSSDSTVHTVVRKTSTELITNEPWYIKLPGNPTTTIKLHCNQQTTADLLPVQCHLLDISVAAKLCCWPESSEAGRQVAALSPQPSWCPAICIITLQL